MQLDKVKRRLGITNNHQDTLINDLISDAESYFKLITGSDSVVDKYQFIITDVTAKLYVKKGSEGTESESVDGYSVSYATSLFEEYLPFLERDFDLNNDTYERRGSVMFYWKHHTQLHY